MNNRVVHHIKAHGYCFPHVSSSTQFISTASSVFDGAGDLSHKQLTNYWTDQVPRTEMMQLNFKNLTPPGVDTQGSLAYCCFFHQKPYYHYGIWLHEKIEVYIGRNATSTNDRKKMTELRSCC